MNQTHFDSRVYTKAAGPMITGAAEPVAARARAIREGRHSRLVNVCAWCASDAVKRSLDGLDNVSHGVCTPCMERVTGEEVRA